MSLFPQGRDRTTDVIFFSKELVEGLDGTMGKTWQQVADDIRAGEPQVPVYVDRVQMADLIQALIDRGALED